MGSIPPPQISRQAQSQTCPGERGYITAALFRPVETGSLKTFSSVEEGSLTNSRIETSGSLSVCALHPPSNGCQRHAKIGRSDRQFTQNFVALIFVLQFFY